MCSWMVSQSWRSSSEGGSGRYRGTGAAQNTPAAAAPVQRSMMTQPNGITSRYTYNNRNLLTELAHGKGAPQVDLADYVYTYDAAGQRLTATETLRAIRIDGNDDRR